MIYSKKVFQPNELQLRQLQDLLKSPSWVALKEWSDFEYSEWCKYWMSLIPQLDLMNEDDKRTLEREYEATLAVSEWLARIQRLGKEYIGEKIIPE